MSSRVALVVLALLALSGRALAQPPIAGPITSPEATQEEEQAGPKLIRIGLTGFAGANTYGMQDWNDHLDRDFKTVATDALPDVSSPRIGNGLSTGGGIRMFLKDRYLLELGFERLFSTTNWGGEALTWDLRADANVYLVTVGINFLSNRSIRFGFEGGVGQYKVDFKESVAADGRTVVMYSRADSTAEISNRDLVLDNGTAMGQHYAAFTEVRFAENMTLVASVGYRRAMLSDATGRYTEDGQEVDFAAVGTSFDEVIKPPTFDWSGFAGKIGLTRYIF